MVEQGTIPRPARRHGPQAKKQHTRAKPTTQTTTKEVTYFHSDKRIGWFLHVMRKSRCIRVGMIRMKGKRAAITCPGRLWPNLAGCGQLQPAVASCGLLLLTVASCGWLQVAMVGQRLAMVAFGWLWPATASCGWLHLAIVGQMRLWLAKTWLRLGRMMAVVHGLSSSGYGIGSHTQLNVGLHMGMQTAVAVWSRGSRDVMQRHSRASPHASEHA